MKKIVFIESNTTGTGKIFISKAIDKGYEVIFLTCDATRYPFLNELMVVPILINTKDVGGMRSYLNEIDDIEAVFSSSEYYIETASNLANSLGLKCNDHESIRNCRDKLLLFEKLTENAINTPKSILITDRCEAEKLLSKIKFPVVIKPVTGSGSVGVKRCDSVEDYLQHINYLLNDTPVNDLQSRILVQEYINGAEYSLEIIGDGSNYHILGITQKYLGPEPYFVEIGHDFPAKINIEISEKIINTIIQSMRIMGFVFGAAHVEFRLQNNNVFIIEINPRLAGGMIPILIQEASGIDVLDLVLDLHCGKNILLNQTVKQYSSIRFILPQTEGKIVDIQQIEIIAEMQGVKTFNLSKKIGDTVTQYGDYRDRIGYIITADADLNTSRFTVDNALNALSIKIVENTYSNSTGRLSQSLHQDALTIVNQNLSEIGLMNELLLLSEIDEAHLVMLKEQKIVSDNIIRQVLITIAEIRKDKYSLFKNKTVLRGSYLLYEQVLIEKLGMDIAGGIHTGRSRNDINATIFKLSTRKLFTSIYQAIWRLRFSILQQVETYSAVEMPVYSQYQTALPGKYSFYLLAIAHALARDQAALRVIYESLSECPLGAGAGCGTSFPINPMRTATLLGFNSVTINALDAVASRDLAVRLLSCLSITGMTLSRIAQDYQLWTTQEFSFFDLPDNLLGGSSMLPQKKNPYLLEKIKGKANIPVGQFVTSLSIMQKTLFSNSVEVGTEALFEFDKSFKAIEDCANLLRLIIENARPIPENINKSIHKGLTASLCVAELLAKSGIPFRQAHHTVAETINEAFKLNINPEDMIIKLVKNNESKNEFWSETFNYGGGPSSASVRDQLNLSLLTLKNDSAWVHKIMAFWNNASILRSEEVNKIIYTN